MTEHVLVVPTALFHELGHFQGFCAEAERYLPVLLDAGQTSYQPRDRVEDDPSLKQLIPYCIFRHDGRVFHYTRSTLQGERRLHSKRSIGIGGHICSGDAPGGSPYREGMQREIDEEVDLATTFTERCVGLINDDQTDVGRVHLGIVHVFDLDLPKVRPREVSIIETGFADPAELARARHDFETWSQICLDYLLRVRDHGWP